MHKKLIVIFIYFLYSISLAQTANSKFEKYSINDGLSQNTVYSVFQDDLGFIWVGTQNGLNRFDGYDFKLYDTFKDGNKSISKSYINAITAYKKGNSQILLLGTEKGLVEFDPQTEECNIYQYEDGLTTNAVKILFIDSENYLWIGTNKGLNKFDLNTKRVKRFLRMENDTESLGSNYIKSICETKKFIWVGTNEGLLHSFDKASNKFKRYEVVADSETFFNENNVYQILEDEDDNLILATDVGLKTFIPSTGEVIENKYYSLISKKYGSIPINSVVVYNNKMFLGTGGEGMFQVNMRDKHFFNYKKNILSKNTIGSDVVFTMMVDRYKILWVGTVSGGLNKLNLLDKKFALLRNDIDSKINLPSNNIYSLLVLDKEIWIGTIDGLAVIDFSNGDLISQVNLKTKHYLKGNRISDLQYDDEYKKVWIAANSGLYEYDVRSKKMQNYVHDANNYNSISSNNTYSIFIDDRGSLWVGTVGGGLNRLLRKSKKFVHYKFDEQDPTSIRGYRIYGGYQDSEGDLFFCTDNGISKYNFDEDNFTNYYSSPTNPVGLIHNVVRQIFEDSKGRYWVGTSAGLCFFDKENEKFNKITDLQELPEDWIYSIQEDSKGNLWFTTNNGLYKLDYDKKLLKHYTDHDGLQNNEFNRSSFKDKYDNMYFSGIDGLNIFHPDDVIDDSSPPVVAITDFGLYNSSIDIGVKLGNDKALKRNITYQNRIELNHDQNFFTIEFVALNFQHTDENQYAYMVEGLDDQWNYVGNRNYVTFTNLPPGDYSFKVKAANHDGYWNEKGASLRIVIIPPFYKTIWFYISAGALLLSIIYAFYRYRTRLLEIKANLLKDKVKAKTADLTKLNSELINQIDETKKAQMKLHASEEKYRYLVENINDVIFSVIENKKISYISPAILSTLGFTSEEMKKNDFSNYFKPEDWQKFEKRFDASTNFEPITGDYRMMSKIKEVRWMRISEKPIVHDGKITGSQGVLTDITERKLLESQLVQSQKLESIGQLAAGIAHEINTPIQFVGDNTQFLSESLNGIFDVFGQYDDLIDGLQRGENFEEIVAKIIESKEDLDLEYLSEEIPVAIKQTMEGVERVAQIVRAMKDFSHPGVEDKVGTDINRAISSTVIVSRNEWKYVADMEENYEEGLPPVPCLPGQFNQVILNIIINAAHAIDDMTEDDDKGKISISTRSLEDSIEIKISDNGKGIPDSIKEKIFDPFFTTKDVGKGTGQGLSIARDIIINKHDGTINVESEEGKGTTFILTLPLNNESERKEVLQDIEEES